jgi:hypothetical protein
VPLTLGQALLALFELTRLDRALMRILLAHFETYYVLGNMMVYVIVSAVSKAAYPGPLESGWSILFHTVLCLSGSVWVATADAAAMPRGLRVGGMSLSLLSAIRWFVTELVSPRFIDNRDVCLFACSKLSAIALGTLFTMILFASKQLYLAAFTTHLSVVRVEPLVFLAGHRPRSQTTRASSWTSVAVPRSSEIDLAGGGAQPSVAAAGSGSTEISRSAARPVALPENWEPLESEGEVVHTLLRRVVLASPTLRRRRPRVLPQYADRPHAGTELRRRWMVADAGWPLLMLSSGSLPQKPRRLPIVERPSKDTGNENHYTFIVQSQTRRHTPTHVG